MQITDDEKHERILHVGIRKGQLEGIIERAIAEKTGIPVEILRRYGKLSIEPNMEGSPSYQNGHCASYRATIPIASDNGVGSGDASPQASPRPTVTPDLVMEG